MKTRRQEKILELINTLEIDTQDELLKPVSYTHLFPGLGLEFTLNSDAFSIGSFTIKWYGIIIAVGFLLAFLYALASCKKMKINQDRFLDAVIVGIVLGIIGARLYYCLFFRDANGNNPYIENPVNILYKMCIRDRL